MKAKNKILKIGAGVCCLLWPFLGSAETASLEWVFADGQRQVETVDLIQDGANFSWRISRDDLRARKAKKLVLTPAFGHAKKGEDGFWVVSTGQLGTFRCENGKFACKWPSMSMFGMKTPRRTFVAIVKGLKYYFHTVVEAKDGSYSMSCVLDEELCQEPYEDFEIEFRMLEGDEASYAGMARAYRKYQLDRKAIVPLRERAKNNVALKDAVEGLEVRVRQAWKPVPSPLPDQVPENEPAIKKVVVTFDRVGDIAREMKKQGVGKAELCLVGWNIGGHDGRYPQNFPVEAALGGEVKLRQCIKDTLACGYMIVPHGNFRDCYRIAEGFDLEYLVKDRHGDPIQAHSQFWGAGRQYQACPQRAYERYAFREIPRMAALGFKGMGYFDVVTILVAPKCEDPRHPLSRAESAKFWGKSAEVSRQFFGGFASEGSLDHFAGSLDSVLYASFGDPRKTNKGLVDRISPIWQLVYNGIIVNNPFTTTVNFTAQDNYSRLKLLEFGGRPNFYFYSKFVDDGTDWMGKSDLGCATDEELVRSVAKIKVGWDIYSQVNHLQYEFMENHEELSDGVFRTTWANGESITVDYNKGTWEQAKR